jgi:predicted acyltransferase
MGKNFGSYIDLISMNQINEGGWTFINFLPTAAHTIWGVIAGKILLGKNDNLDKFKTLATAGIIGIVVGYGMDLFGITLIIKRICTSSFVIVSGGWCFLTLAVFYYLVDIKNYNKGIKIFVAVGMNSIFIYMFSQTLGIQWFNGFVNIFTSGFANYFSLHVELSNILNSILVFALELYLCFWLYKRKIFFKI